MAKYLITGVAGFIASRVTGMLIATPVHPADVFRNVADVSKARQLLGWQPQTSLNEGITNPVDWYLQEREWVKDITTP